LSPSVKSQVNHIVKNLLESSPNDLKLIYSYLFMLSITILLFTCKWEKEFFSMYAHDWSK
jgi:hypothetical protein